MAIKLSHGDEEFEIDIVDASTVRVNGRELAVTNQRDNAVRLGTQTAWTVRSGDARWVFFDGRTYELIEARAASRRRSRGHHDALSAPMPATVRRLAVTPGDRVNAGDVLIVLEAMKMELPVRAAHAGTVRAIACREGELVQPGVPLIELTEG
jgi:3-methylcrotonyl-CoA carboxylase alpha subunit